MVYPDVLWEQLLLAAYEHIASLGWSANLSVDEYYMLALQSSPKCELMPMIADFLMAKAVVENEDPYDMAKIAEDHKQGIIARFAPWLKSKVEVNRKKLN